MSGISPISPVNVNRAPRHDEAVGERKLSLKNTAKSGDSGTEITRRNFSNLVDDAVDFFKNDTGTESENNAKREQLLNAIDTVGGALDGLKNIDKSLNKLKTLTIVLKNNDTMTFEDFNGQAQNILKDIAKNVGGPTANGGALLSDANSTLYVNENYNIKGVDLLNGGKGDLFTDAVFMKNEGGSPIPQMNAFLTFADENELKDAVDQAITIVRDVADGFSRHLSGLQADLQHLSHTSQQQMGGDAAFNFDELNEEAANLIALQTRQFIDFDSIGMDNNKKDAILKLL